MLGAPLALDASGVLLTGTESGWGHLQKTGHPFINDRCPFNTAILTQFQLLDLPPPPSPNTPALAFLRTYACPHLRTSTCGLALLRTTALAHVRNSAPPANLLPVTFAGFSN